MSVAASLLLLCAGGSFGLLGAGMAAGAIPPTPLLAGAHPEARVVFPDAVQIGGDSAVIAVNYTAHGWSDLGSPAHADSGIIGAALYVILPDGLEIASAGFAEADVVHVIRAGHPDEFAMREYRANTSSAARDGWALWEVEIRAVGAGPPAEGSTVTAGAWGAGQSASLSVSNGTVSFLPRRDGQGLAGTGWAGPEMAVVPADADARPVMPPMGELAEHLRDAIPPGTDAATWLRLYAPFLTEQYVLRLLAEHPEIGSRGSGDGSAHGAAGQSGGSPPFPPGLLPPPPGSGLRATQYYLSGALDVRAVNGTMKGAGGVGVCFYDADNGMSGVGAKPTLLQTLEGQDACTVTRRDGSYSILVAGGNLPGGSGPGSDLRIFFTLNGSRAAVINGAGNVWELEGPRLPNFSNFTHSYGRIAAPDSGSFRGAAWIFEATNAAHGHVLDLGYDAPPVTVRWPLNTEYPSVSTYNASGLEINLASRKYQGYFGTYGAEAYPSTIAKEYGWHVLASVYAKANATFPEFGIGCNAFYLTFAVNAECAWVEGFAEYLAASAADSPVVRYYEYAREIDYEGRRYHYGLAIDHFFADGPAVPGNVASLLWDLRDAGPGEAGDTVAGREADLWRALGAGRGQGAQAAANSTVAFESSWAMRGLPPLASAMVLNRIYDMQSVLARADLTPSASYKFDGDHVGDWIMSGAADVGGNWEARARAGLGDASQAARAGVEDPVLAAQGCGGNGSTGCVATLAAAVETPHYLRVEYAALAAGGPSSALLVQYSANGSLWADIGPPLRGGAGDWQRHAALVDRSGGAGGSNASYLRLVAYTAPLGAGTVAVDNVDVRGDSPPSLSFPPPQSILIGRDRVAFVAFNATDAEGDDIFLSQGPGEDVPFALVHDRGGGRGLLELKPNRTDAGNYTISIVASSRLNLTDTVSVGVVVADIAPPDISPPLDVAVPVSCTSTAVNLTRPAVSDNADPSPRLEASPAWSRFPLGTTQVVWTATDSSGNRATVVQNVTVYDLVGPEITVSAAGPFEASGVRTPVALEPPAVSDNSCERIAPASDMPAGGLLIGTTPINWTATDSSGNRATAVQNVTVRDTTPPVFGDVGPGGSWLGAYVLEATGSLTSVALPTPNTTDNSGRGPAVGSDLPLAGLPLGTITVNWTATDAYNNTNVARQNVTVQDTTKPVLTIVPYCVALAEGPLTPLQSGPCGRPVVHDIVDENVTVLHDAPAEGLLRGKTPVNWTAIDDSGNNASAGQVVNILPVSAPDTPAGLNASYSPGNGNATVVLEWSDPLDRSITGYEIFRTGAAHTTPYNRARVADHMEPIVMSSGNVVLAFTDVTVQPGVSYEYAVRARNDPHDFSNYSNAAQVHAGPPAPIGLAAHDARDRIALEWDAPGHAAGGYTAYRVAVSRGEGPLPSPGGQGPVSVALAANTTAYGDTAIEAGVAYEYYLRATDASGTASTWAGPAVASAAPLPPPSAAAASRSPTIISGLVRNVAVAGGEAGHAAPGSPAPVSLLWPRPADPTVTGYEVVRAAPAEPARPVVFAVAGAANTSFSDASVAPSTAYEYSVRSVNPIGTSPPSDPVRVWTTRPAPVTLLDEKFDLPPQRPRPGGNASWSYWQEVSAGAGNASCAGAPAVYLLGHQRAAAPAAPGRDPTPSAAVLAAANLSARPGQGTVLPQAQGSCWLERTGMSFPLTSVPLQESAASQGRHDIVANVTYRIETSLPRGAPMNPVFLEIVDSSNTTLASWFLPPDRYHRMLTDSGYLGRSYILRNVDLQESCPCTVLVYASGKHGADLLQRVRIDSLSVWAVPYARHGLDEQFSDLARWWVGGNWSSARVADADGAAAGHLVLQAPFPSPQPPADGAQSAPARAAVAAGCADGSPCSLELAGGLLMARGPYVEMSLRWHAGSLRTGEYLRLDISNTTGANWTTALLAQGGPEHRGNASWTTARIGIGNLPAIDLDGRLPSSTAGYSFPDGLDSEVHLEAAGSSGANFSARITTNAGGPVAVDWLRIESPPLRTNTMYPRSGSGGTNLAWTPTGDPATIGYEVFRRINSTFLLQGTVNGSATSSYTDAEATEDERRLYRLRAVGGTGYSVLSTFLYAAAAPPAPENLTYSAVTPPAQQRQPGGAGPVPSVTISWDDASVREPGHRIMRQGPGDPIMSVIKGRLPHGNANYTDAAAVAPGANTYAVAAANFGGFSSYAPVAVPVLAAPPPPPPVEATCPGTRVALPRPSLPAGFAALVLEPRPPEGYNFAVGTTAVEWTATGPNGTSTAAYNVTVTDTTPPQLEPLPDLAVNATASLTAVALAVPGVSDNSCGEVQIALRANSSSGNALNAFIPVPRGDAFTYMLPVGTSTITWNATDHSGNSAILRHAVDVADISPPVFADIPDAVIEAKAACMAVDESGIVQPNATDAADPSPEVTAGASRVCLGPNVVVWTATDDSGNMASANQSVLVVDTTPPSITAPSNKTIEAALRCIDVTRPELGLPGVSDLVDTDPSVSYSPAGPYCLGETTVTWTATDFSGNVANATQSVVVQDAAPPWVAEDTTPPAITALYDITVVSSVPTRIPRSDYDAISVSDSQDPRPSLAYAPPVLSSGRSHTVTWTATDWAGNSASTNNTVRVTPDEECRQMTVKTDPYLRRTTSNPDLFKGVRTIANAGTLPISSVYMNATDWIVSPSGMTLPANLTTYRVEGGGHPSEWTSLSGTAVPPDPVKPHRSFDVQIQVNLTGVIDSNNLTMNQNVRYNPSCIGQGAGAGGASGQAPASSVAHGSAEPPVVSMFIIAPGPAEN